MKYPRSVPAKEINQNVRRIQRGEASGLPCTHYSSYNDGYEGGSYHGGGSGGDSFGGDGLADLLMFILFALGEGDE